MEFKKQMELDKELYGMSAYEVEENGNKRRIDPRKLVLTYVKKTDGQPFVMQQLKNLASKEERSIEQETERQNKDK